MKSVADGLALALVLAAIGAVGVVYFRWEYREQRFNKQIEATASRLGVDKFLVKAVMRCESGFDPFARSPKGAIGLMQVTEPAGRDWARSVGRREFSADLLWDTRVNIEAGTWYLGRALVYWKQAGADDPVPFALAEYNAGRERVRMWIPKQGELRSERFLAAITWPGVRRYVEKVTEYHAYYTAQGKL
jgi:soluble lytic murein transglycosylase